MHPIDRAVEVLGSQTELAKVMGVTPSFVNQIVQGVRPVPATHCLAIERACDGQVTANELRPDVFGDTAA